MIKFDASRTLIATCDTVGCGASFPLIHYTCDNLAARKHLVHNGWGLIGDDDPATFCPEHKPGARPDLTETVNHPQHYGGGDNPYEAIKVIEAWGLGFCLGNTVKYIARHAHKGSPLEDLKKARWYLQREIEKLESEKS